MRIHKNQLAAGSYLFNTNKKKKLKKLFLVFNKSKNGFIFYNFFFSKFFFYSFFNITGLKYAKIFSPFRIFSTPLLNLFHSNLNKLFRFKLMKLNFKRLFRFPRKHIKKLLRVRRKRLFRKF